VTPAVKICGLTRRTDAAAAERAGATYLGAVLAPSPRRVEASSAAAMFEGLSARRVGVFVNADERELARTGECAGLDVLQLHGDEPPELFRTLRAAGEWQLWKAVRVRAAADLEEAIDRFGDVADALLLDAWADGARGGTGRTFPWDEVAPVRDRMPDRLGLIVAGGLRATNVARAVEVLRPDVVDVGSGVESSPGIKDHDEIGRLMDTLKDGMR
jgi:phosphoribosylanthranilate isomerase